MAITRIIYQTNALSLTDEEEEALEEVAPEYDATRIDGMLVYWISSDTIDDYIAEMEPDKEKLAVLKSLDRKLKARFGADFDTFDFLFE